MESSFLLENSYRTIRHSSRALYGSMGHALDIHIFWIFESCKTTLLLHKMTK